jgi:hypothetical protein
VIGVVFVEPSEPAWTSWKNDSDRATADLIRHAQPGLSPKIDDTMYKGAARDFIFAAFHQKCAYCEVHFILDQTGDVEHYRPKAGLTDEHDKPVMVMTGHHKKDFSEHKGYYWLAYDWHNLLPSCSKCNRIRNTKDGRKVGKGTRFPIAGARAIKPGDDLALELPLFLHPYYDNPAEHLIFDPETGLIAGKTPRGEALVNFLDLNREGLPEARRESYWSAISKLVESVSAARFGDRGTAMRHLFYLRACLEGEVPFAWPAQLALAGACDLKSVLLELAALLEVAATLGKPKE